MEEISDTYKVLFHKPPKRPLWIQNDGWHYNGCWGNGGKVVLNSTGPRENVMVVYYKHDIQILSPIKIRPAQ